MATPQTIIILVTIVPLVIIGAIILITMCWLRTKSGSKLFNSVTTDVFRATETALSNLPALALSDPRIVQSDKRDSSPMEIFLQDLAKQNPIRFTGQQLSSFTDNYSRTLGSGGFGVVYKGTLPNGIDIAVKVLKKKSDQQAEEQFMAEVGTIGKTYHLNLIKLIGFCYNYQMAALVYEYMENGSLDKYLFGNDGNNKLDWDQLHEIAIGTAKGIAYLHEECEQRIIHYDIKPGNVLLDSKFTPKVADFGLAKLTNREETHISVYGYRGTPGYLAPEFMLMNFPISYKCDVYSFGMLLFEILGQRKNANVGRSIAESSLDWFPKQVWDEHEKGRLDAMILDYGINEKDSEKAKRMAWIALWCAQSSPDERPLMSSVVRMLEGGMEIKPPLKPFGYLYSSGINNNAFNLSLYESSSINSSVDQSPSSTRGLLS